MVNTMEGRVNKGIGEINHVIMMVGKKIKTDMKYKAKHDT